MIAALPQLQSVQNIALWCSYKLEWWLHFHLFSSHFTLVQSPRDLKQHYALHSIVVDCLSISLELTKKKVVLFQQYWTCFFLSNTNQTFTKMNIVLCFRKGLFYYFSEDLNTDPATLKSIGVKRAKGKTKLWDPAKFQETPFALSLRTSK